jgi:hypothetical protein
LVQQQPRSPFPSWLRRRPRLLALIVILLIAVLVGSVVVLTRPQSTGTVTATQTTWAAITGKIRNGRPSKEVALEALSYLYRVDIPGVHVPAGTSGADVPPSATEVTRWVQANWNELTPEQQAVVNRYLLAGPNDTVVTYDLTTGVGVTRRGGERGPVAIGAGFGVTAAKVVLPPVAGQPGMDAPSDAVQQAFRDELFGDIAHIGQRLGLPQISEGIGLWTNVTVTYSEEDGGNTLFTTIGSVNGAGIYSPCNIIVWKNSWSGAQVSGGKLSDALHVLVTHEVIHCYQNTIWGSVPVATSIPPWITEGTALWLAADDTKILETMVASQWRTGYFEYPERALTNRTYDGYGYFALLAHLGRDMWGSMVPAWRAAAASTTSRSDPFIAVLNGDASDVRDAWAPSYLRQSSWGDPWVAYGFGLPDDAQVNRHPIAALEDPGYLGSLDSRSNTIDSVEQSAGEIVLVQTDGLASARDDAGHSDLSFGSHRFCVSGTCICPPKTLHAGERMADDDMTMPFVLAFDAPEGGARYRVVGRSLEDECGREQDDPYPLPGSGGPGTGGGSSGGGDADTPCGSGCAGSNGDPHMRTVNNAYYEFQAAGEFTLLRSPDGALEIQARQEPYKGSDHVAINTALAARVNGHRVGVYFTGDSLVARVDGQVIDGSPPVDLGDGAKLARHTRGFEIDLPDGTQLWALSVGAWGINVQMRPSEALRAQGMGILGSVIPGGMAVPKLPDGTRLPRPADNHQRYQMLYQTFAGAWRVTDASTLFDYEAGTSTASYTKAGFPNEATDTTPRDLSPTDRDAAAPACAAITDPLLFEECLFDVSVTGDVGYADIYRMVLQLLAAGGITLDAPPEASVPPGPTSSPGPIGSTTPGPSPIGAVVTGLSLLRGWAVGPDGTLYLSIQYPDDRVELDAIDPRQGVVLHRIDEQGGGELAYAAGSVWAGEVGGGTDCAVSRLDPATFAVLATIKSTCNFFQSLFASTGDDVWLIDRSLEGYSKEGIRRIDPTTNTASDPIELPFLNGYLYGAPTALVYGDEDKGWYSLAVGSTSLQPLGARLAPIYPTGNGIWDGQDAVAEYFTGDGPPAQTLPIDGSLVGADEQALYVEQASNQDSTSELWRYPINGNEPVRVGQAPPPYADQTFSYFDNSPLIATGPAVIKVWVVTYNGVPVTGLFVQWLPTGQ